MSYPFNQRQPGYSVPQNFTPWSQSMGGLLGNSTPTLPFTPYMPFSFQHPFFIHQQNNFYNSNFTIPPTISNFQPQLAKPQRPVALRKPMPYSRPPQPPSQFIVISDDEEPSSAAKNLMAVVREKCEPQLIRPQFAKMLTKPRNEKETMEGRRFTDHRDTLERRDNKLFKKAVRPETKEEETARDDLQAKKKKISKERSGYRLTEHLRQLMQVSRYREYRPDLIMVGPQFQAAIEDKQLYEERQAWLQTRRENLQQRRHE